MNKNEEIRQNTTSAAQSELLAYRAEIDAIDRQLTELYEKRMAVSEQVADYKIRSGKSVLDPAREQQKLDQLSTLAHTEFNRQGIRELFRQIMAMSRKRQYQLLEERQKAKHLPFIAVDSLTDKPFRVVYQGAPGSYSEAAMHSFFGADAESFAVQTFRDAMTAIEEGTAEYAVLPIENSTAGTVTQTYDLLDEFENYIVGEQIIPIRHCLMGVPGTTLSTIKTVYSHAQSLMQSDRFLTGHPDWQQISMLNNAYAAEKVAADNDVTEAAIASRYAAEYCHLEILKEGVNNEEGNSTRFIVCTNQKIFLKSARKISICLELRHESGSLYRALSHFIYNNLNMTKIESRPIRGRNWEYRFFIDFEGNFEDAGVRNALRGLRDEARSLKVLGNY